MSKYPLMETARRKNWTVVSMKNDCNAVFTGDA